MAINVNVYLIVGLGFSILIILYLIWRMRRVRQQLSFIKDALHDIKDGNLNRRIVTRENDMTKQICYDINSIVIDSQLRIIQQRQAEQAYKRLMTSLSHDVKTPLTSLVGYLEAIEKGIVTGTERDEYIHVALDKANRLKDFVTILFEWVKLDAREQVFHFEILDINELSRIIIFLKKVDVLGQKMSVIVFLSNGKILKMTQKHISIMLSISAKVKYPKKQKLDHRNHV